MMYAWNDGAYLAHHGIKGQKWGVRRFQNEDGSLTSAGRARYGSTEYFMNKSEKAKTRFMKAAYERRANQNKYYDNRVGDIARGRLNSSGKTKFGDRARTVNPFGAAAMARKSELTAANYKTNAKYSRTEFGKKLNERRAYNAEQWAKSWSKVANAHGLNIAGAKMNMMFNTPVKNVLTGKDTTSGKQMVLAMLAGIGTQVVTDAAGKAIVNKMIDD